MDIFPFIALATRRKRKPEEPHNGSERRNINGGQRRHRVSVGSASVPVAIIINFIVMKQWGIVLSDEMLIAVSTLIGSITSVVSICFYDLRGILLSRFMRRRQGE